MKKKVVKQKICSRGHKFTPPGPCPVCWPASRSRKRGERQLGNSCRLKKFKDNESRACVELMLDDAGAADLAAATRCL